MAYADSLSTDATVNSQNSSTDGARKQTKIEEGQENVESSNSSTKMKDTLTVQEQSKKQNNNTTGMSYFLIELS